MRDPTGPVPVVLGFDDYVRGHGAQGEPTGPVPVVNRFDDYVRNRRNADSVPSFRTLLHRRGAGWESLPDASAA